MNKVMVFLRAAAAASGNDFQHAILALARSSGLPAPLRDEAMTVNLVRVPPEPLPYRPPSDSSLGLPPEYDAIIEIWGRRSGREIAADMHAALDGTVAALHAYAVTATQIYHRRPFAQGQPSAGVKLIGRLMFHADMPDSAARRSWTLHAALAERVHIGSALYVQNWVDQPLTDTCPAARGMPIMHFPTEADFLHAFVDSARGMQEILQDTAHFVAGGPRFYTTEYVIRPRR